LSTGKGAFLGKAGPLVLARLLSSVVTFFIPLVLARVMTLRDYGTYKQLFLIHQLLYFVLPFGVAQSLYYFLPRAESRKPYLFQTMLYMAAAGIVGATLVLSFSGVAAHRFSNPELWNHRWALAVYTGCLLGAWPLEISLTGQGKTGSAARVYLISDAVRAASLVVPVFFGAGLRGLMISTAGFAFARLIASWIVVMPKREKEDGSPLWVPALFKRQIQYAAPFGAAMALNIPQSNFHQFVVSDAVSPELFAIYAVGCFQLPLVDLLYSPTSEVLMVRLGELERAEAWQEGVDSFRAAATQLIYCFWPMAAFLWIAAPQFIAALFGARFLDAVPMFRFSLTGVCLAVLPLDGALRARNQTAHIFNSYLIKAVVTVPLVFLLVKQFGMIGGIASWAGAELVGKATLFARVPKALSGPNLKFTWRDIVPWRAAAHAALASIASAAVVAVALWWSKPFFQAGQGIWGRAIPLAVAGAIFGVSYLLLLQAGGVQPMRLLAGLRRPRAAVASSS